MKIGLVSDSLAHLDFETLLDTAARLGIAGVEMTTGNFSTAPHLDLAGLLADAGRRRAFRDAFARRGLEIAALNASGNVLHPLEGAAHDRCARDTIRLAAALGVSTVVMMSGLPEGAPGDRVPNWVVSSWPPETQTVLRYQWEERLLPYWHDLAAFARSEGIERIALELHGNQLVYNVPTLLRLRAAAGPVVGANLDPSHLFWMGADPLAAADALGPAIHHAHAKDTLLLAPKQATVSLLENGPLDDIAARSWSYVTLGYGHDEGWWRAFCFRLRLAGYDGWLSIEHEDVVLARTEGVSRAVDLLRRAAPGDPADYAPQAV